MPSIPLADGEYLIWSSPRSRTLKAGPRQVVGFSILFFYLFSSLVVLCAFVGWPGFIGFVFFVLGIVVSVRWYQRRTAFFMTNRHLIDAGIIFKQKIPLSSIRACERYIQETRTRWGVERVQTDKMRILSGGQTVMFGPVFDFDGIWQLIHHAVLGNAIKISALPSLDGGTAPAEKRTDLLLVVSTKTDGDVYGLLFIGPTKIIRFTDKLPSLLEGILFTVAAAENSAEEMESHMLQLVKHPQAGHATVLDRDMAAASVEGNELALTGAENVIKIELRPADVTRTAAFVRIWRPAHPMR